MQDCWHSLKVSRPGRPIIVLGPERSGTSAWAEMIATWGAFAGNADDLPAPDELNPHGRREYGPLWDFLEILGDFSDGVTWWEESFPRRVAAKADDPQLRSSAQALVSQMERRGQPWVWKDPALCHFLPFWRQIWDDPVYVITIRNPLDVATSWQQFARLNGQRPTSVACNLLRWQYMIQSVLRETGEIPARIFVEYESLVRHPVEQSHRLAAALDRYCGRDTDEICIRAMANNCDSALWRNRVGASGTDSAMTAAQTALYQMLRERAADVPGPTDHSYPMPDGWRTLVINDERPANESAVQGMA
jgi:hypothetical protein